MSVEKLFFDLVELGLEEYEENEFVFNTIAEVQEIFHNSENCTCYRRSNTKNFHPCFEIIGFKPFFECLIHLKGLDKKEKDLFIKTQLMIGNLSSNKDDQKVYYKYQFNGLIKICQSIFMKLCGIGKRTLENLQDHYKQYGLDERIHGNTGRAPSLESKIKITNEIATSVKNFLNNYALDCGLPSPMRSRKDSDVFIYLPTDATYTSVYEEYKRHYIKEIDNNVISRVSFCRLWKQLMPHFKFQPLATDMCDTCTDFKAQLKSKANENNYEEIQGKYTEHQQLAKIERDLYTKNIMKSINFNNVANILYDWAQNVSIPHLPQQPGAMYFKSGYNVNIFGVCRTDGGENIQLNYLVGDDEFPQGVSKGSNTTLNLVYHALNKLARVGKEKLQITCDNCGAQNKNNLSLWFWSWLIMKGWYKEICVNFMIPGHTKFLCDGYFGNIKQKYKYAKINTIENIEDIVNNSAKANHALLFKKEPDWCWYDFKSYLEGNFQALPQIMKYHHFRFNNASENIGKVYVSEKAGGEEICFQLLKNNSNFEPNRQIGILPLEPLSKEKKEYLYKKVRVHVEDPYKDVHFSKP